MHKYAKRFWLFFLLFFALFALFAAALFSSESVLFSNDNSDVF